ncbi:extracellular solute-binding protein [Pararhizobium arenae]|uniref:extracellular solute-binding protein n=1 Tax=Pararhizobium arenae TaxID=1856850 RepID=UPI00094ABA17
MRRIGSIIENAFRTVIKAVAVAALAGLVASPVLAQEPVWRGGTATVGELKYQDGFKRFDYVNPDAPKGGDLRLTAMGTFDSLNPILAKGEVAAGVAGLVYETLMKPSLDEIASDYGLLAEAIAYPDDFGWVKFRLRPEAKWEDGQPVTPEDVVFSFEKAKALDPQREFYYAHVIKAEKTGDREVTFSFDEKNNRELPKIVGELVIVPKHWWEGKDANGNQRDISKTSLEIPMGSGAYKVASMQAGSTIRFERREDYWGKDINVNIGEDNFGAMIYTYYADLDVAFEAFRSGNADYWWENSAKRWATSYDFPAVKDGRIKLEKLENDYRNRGVLVGFIFNMKREKFGDVRVRKALNYAFDFEELNRTIFYNQYSRIDSFFYGTELASKGVPEGRELEIINEMKDQLPPEVMEPYVSPVGGDPKKVRDNLRQAIGLFKEAGYELKGNRMVNAKTGEPFTFEILLDGPTIERVALPFAQSLKKIGVEVSVRTVDSSQFTNRWRSRDFDVVYQGWGQSLNPGNEQAEYWGSAAANRDGSQNYSGVSDPVLDTLIKRVIFAKDRDELIATTKVLDRVLLAKHIVVPSYTARNSRIAYSSDLEHPAVLPEYSTGFPSIWWRKSAGSQ